jgi:hypothetical protein
MSLMTLNGHTNRVGECLRRLLTIGGSYLRDESRNAIRLSPRNRSYTEAVPTR